MVSNSHSPIRWRLYASMQRFFNSLIPGKRPWWLPPRHPLWRSVTGGDLRQTEPAVACSVTDAHVAIVWIIQPNTMAPCYGEQVWHWRTPRSVSHKFWRGTARPPEEGIRRATLSLRQSISVVSTTALYHRRAHRVFYSVALVILIHRCVGSVFTEKTRLTTYLTKAPHIPSVFTIF